MTLSIVLKGVVGGSLVALIAWTSERGTQLPGILPLFPAFAMFALWIAGCKREPDAFQETTVAAMKTIPPYLLFLVASYLCSSRIDHRLSLIIGVLVWGLATAAIFFTPQALR
jgi:uncharacterized membrane protein (GlpM family)